MTGVLQHLLVATDGSDNGDRAVSFALAFARRHASTLLFCYVIDRAGTIAECSELSGGVGFLPLLQSLDEAAAAILSKAVARATAAGLGATTTVLDGRPVEAIVGCAKERQADGIVMGTQGKRGLERFFLGSTAEGVLRRTDVPVFVVPPGASNANPAFDRILVAVDDSDPSDAAAAFALGLAQADNARLLFCCVAETNDLVNMGASYVYDPTLMLEELRAPAEALLTTHADRARTNDVAVDCVYAEGDPAEEILQAEEAQHADLLVVGTHGRRGLRRLLVGSVAESIVRRSPIPVAVVRACGTPARQASYRVSLRSDGSASSAPASKAYPSVETSIALRVP